MNIEHGCIQQQMGKKNVSSFSRGEEREVVVVHAMQAADFPESDAVLCLLLHELPEGLISFPHRCSCILEEQVGGMQRARKLVLRRCEGTMIDGAKD